MGCVTKFILTHTHTHWSYFQPAKSVDAEADWVTWEAHATVAKLQVERRTLQRARAQTATTFPASTQRPTIRTQPGTETLRTWDSAWCEFLAASPEIQEQLIRGSKDDRREISSVVIDCCGVPSGALSVCLNLFASEIEFEMNAVLNTNKLE